MDNSDIIGQYYVDEHDSGNLLMQVVAQDTLQEGCVIVAPTAMPTRTWQRDAGQIRKLIQEAVWSRLND